MATADRMFYAGLDLPEFSTEGMEMQFSQYQHQIYTSVPSTGNVCPALWCRNMDPLGRRHEDIHMKCQRQVLDVRWWAHVSNAEVLLVCQPLVASYVIDTYLWPCCTPGPWSTSTWCSASDGWYEGMKLMASWRRCRAAITTSGSTRFRRMQTHYCYLCCGDLRSPRVTERRNGSLGLRDDDDDGDDEGWKTCFKNGT